MKKQLLSALVFITLSGAANAQIRFALEPGLNISNYSVQKWAETSGVNIGTRPGGMVDIGLNNHWSVQPGIFYVMNGFRQAYYYTNPLPGKVDLKIDINTIEIPINVMYAFGSAGDNRLFVGAGPYLGINIGGKVTATDMGVKTSQSLAIGSSPTDGLKRIDVGAGVNAGYEFKFGLFVSARYQMGFVNLQPFTGSGGYDIHASSYGISVGYFFSKHIKSKAKAVSTRKQ